MLLRRAITALAGVSFTASRPASFTTRKLMSSGGGDSAAEGEKFDARAYLQTRYFGPANEFRKLFYLRNFHEFYQRFHSEWNPEKARLLEYGGGPCIHTLISAAPYVSEIVFSDYAEDSLKEVRKWRDADPSCFDWSPFFKYVVQELEGQQQPTAAADRERLLRSRVASIIPCDILQEDPLMTTSGGDGSRPTRTSPEPFDVVSCNLTLMVTSKTHDQCKTNLKKLLGLLKPNGFYIGAEPLELSWWSEWWSSGNTVQATAKITADGLHDIMRSSGLEILGSDCVDIPEERRFVASDTKGYMFTVARKV